MQKQKEVNRMNEKMQELIIKELGLIGTLALIGTILVSAFIPENATSITILFGAVTATISSLGTFLTGKNTAEKQEETLEKYYIDKNEPITTQEELEVEYTDKI